MKDAFKIETILIRPCDWNEQNLETKLFQNLVHDTENAGQLTIRQAKTLERGLAQTVFNEYNYRKHEAERDFNKEIAGK